LEPSSACFRQGGNLLGKRLAGVLGLHPPKGGQADPEGAYISRYQDFSKSGFVTPPELAGEDERDYCAAGGALLATYARVKELALARLRDKLPRPADMKPETYERNLAARAFDVARYLLFWGVPTNVGQVTSIRTLEKQIRRFKASEYAELRELADEIAAKCEAVPDCVWGDDVEPLAPTLARHANPDEYAAAARRNLGLWARENLPAPRQEAAPRVDLLRPANTPADIAATLLYPVTDRPYRELYEIACEWSPAQRAEVFDLCILGRGRGDEILAGFRGGPYCYDLAIDIGAYRDLHRHRRCQKYRQEYSGALGFDTPALIEESGATEMYGDAMRSALETAARLPKPGGDYLIPFGARSRFLFKMDFAEAEYIAKLRSGVKGHFSYREVAWEMKRRMEEVEPELGRLMEATPPWIEDPLRR
jgi:thymidylate synthase ThyX